MASATYKNIVVEWPAYSGPRYKEALAAAAIKPGELLEFDGSGDLILSSLGSGTVPVQKMVAVESPLATPGSADAIDTDYASGDTVRYVVPLPGAVLYMEVADGETTAIGDPLIGDGAGALVVATAAATIHDQAVIGYAMEVVTASGATARCLVEAA
jgi:hypothetical protein